MKQAAHDPGPECVKHCPCCGACFSRKDLMKLRSLTPIGMLHIQGQPAASAIYCFSHTRWSCRTTFALPVVTFREEIKEPIPDDMLRGTIQCEGHCAQVDDLENCTANCALAPYRRFLLERLVPRK